MTFLPIVYRELRVSARGKATRRLRVLFAVGAVAIAGALGLVSLASGGSFTSQLGQMIFGALKWIGFVFGCCAGIFLTADCLSEEKREGTMGLLFLTDLRGHDVVFGKLLATSLRSFYSLLAVFPVMALSFVLGGVAAVDFRHVLICLCNTLFFSLALGMAVSVVSRDSHKAMTGALAGMIGFLFLIPELDGLLLGRNANHPALSLFSPIYTVTHTDSYHAADFWISTLAVHLAGWSFLLAASWLAPKFWQEKEVRAGAGMKWRIPLFGSHGGRSPPRGLLEQNPVCWIIARDRWASNLARLALLVVCGVFALSLVSFSKSPGLTAVPPATPAGAATITTTNSASRGAVTFSFSVSSSGISGSRPFRFASWCAGALSLALEFWLASHAARFYVDGKKNGFLELLLVTPIRPAEIVRGHWLALRRLFLAPMAAQLFLSLAVGIISILAMLSRLVAVPVAGATASWWTPSRVLVIQQSFALVIGSVSWVTGLFAIAWCSIWMGLASKKVNIAMLKTFWYVKILPWFGATFLTGLLFVPLTRVIGGTPGWIIIAIISLPYSLMIGVNFFLMTVARRNAQKAFLKWSVS